MNKNKLKIISIILIAINMRLPITAIPPLLADLQSQVGFSTQQFGLLTTIPLITFALVSPLLAKLGNRFGNQKVILVFTVLLVIGSLLRTEFSIPIILFGTFLIGMGIHSANVLLPAVIKEEMPNDTMRGMSIYSTTMLLMGALGTGIMGFISSHYSLKAALWTLTLLSIISLIGWFPQGISKQITGDKFNNSNMKSNHQKPSKSVWRSKLGWTVTIFFGIQALLYYSLITWLPTIFMNMGYDRETAGLLVTILQFSTMPCAFVIPMLANNIQYINKLIWALSGGLIIGLIGLLIPIHNPFWHGGLALIIGISSGIAFNMAIIFFSQKSVNSHQTADLSGMAQSWGYLLAAIGPILFGTLQTIFHSWSMVLIISIILSVLLLIDGLIVNKLKPLS